MKTIKTISVVESKNELETITCDCCGKMDMIPHYSDIQEHLIQFGYGSSMDGDEWHLDICDECITEWVNTFKHKIHKESGFA